MYGSTSSICRRQVHGCFFNDRRHSELWNHETTGNFMVANIHRETYFASPFSSRCCGHKTIESLDQTRRRVLRGISRGGGRGDYYVQFKWMVHPTAYSRDGFSRIIGRVSMAHR